MELNLKNCPFCNSDNVAIQAIHGRFGWFVFGKCNMCESQGRRYKNKVGSLNDDDFWEDRSVAMAEMAWNMRGGNSDE